MKHGVVDYDGLESNSSIYLSTTMSRLSPSSFTLNSRSMLGWAPGWGGAEKRKKCTCWGQGVGDQRHQARCMKRWEASGKRMLQGIGGNFRSGTSEGSMQLIACLHP